MAESTDKSYVDRRGKLSAAFLQVKEDGGQYSDDNYLYVKTLFNEPW